MAVLGSGDILGDRYRLDDFIAAGGMGQVWRATDIVLGRTVAVKVLLAQLLTDPGFEARFRAEARIIAALRHAGVVNVYDYGESTDADGRRALYLVMAYVEGESLSALITEAGRLSVAQTMSVVAQAAAALEAAHESGVVHRDVKPGNLLVNESGQVTLVDFGVARSTSVTSVTTGNAVPGTALYMAPEQASGQPVTGATDVYALGAVAYHCLAGHPPFTGTNPIEIALKHMQDEPPPLPDDVPLAAQHLVMKAMAKDPAQRYPTAGALAAAAGSVAAGGDAGPGAGALTTAPMRAVAVAGARPGLRGGTPTTAGDLGPVSSGGTGFGGRTGAANRAGRRRAAYLGAAAAVLVASGALALLLAFTKEHNGSTPPATAPTASVSAHPVAPTQPATHTTAPRTATASATRSPAPSAHATTPTKAPTSAAPPPSSAPPKSPPPSSNGPGPSASAQAGQGGGDG
jgi:serine/threonine-protein kinase